MRKLFGLILLLGTMSANAADAADVRLISVTGTVEKTFKPDIVQINLSVWGKGNSGKAAQVKNKEQFEVFMKSIESYKIKKEDIKTTSYNLSPEYTFNPKTNKNNINGYTATQSLIVTLRKLDDAGGFMDSMVSDSTSKMSGINMDSVFFDLDKKGDEERALLGDAVKAAQAQAEVLAKAANVKIKGLYHLTPRPIDTPMVRMNSNQMAMKSMDVMEADMPPTKMMGGEIKINAEVSADYMID
jgi:uncharacterized protein YggE